MTHKKPVLIILAGRPASGKTDGSDFLGQELDCEVLHSDSFRIALFDAPSSASVCQSHMVYNLMFRKAKRILLEKKSVILDATFRFRTHRQRAYGLAESAGANAYIIEAVCSDMNAVKRRLAQRAIASRPLGTTLEEYLRVKKTMDPLMDEVYPSGNGLLIPIVRYDSFANTVSLVSLGSRAMDEIDIGLIGIINALEKWARINTIKNVGGAPHNAYSPDGFTEQRVIV